MSTSINLKRQILRVVKKFRFAELESVVFPIFPEVSWTTIKTKLFKNHQSLTTTHVIELLQEEINKAKLKTKVIKDRLNILNVLYISRYYYKRFWYTHELKGDNNSISFTPEDVQKGMENSFSAMHLEVDIYAVAFKDFIFMSVHNKPLGRRKTSISTYFCLATSEPFVFCSKKLVTKNMLAALAGGIGYKKCKPLKLMGRRIDSLMKMLLAKKAADVQPSIIREPEPFKLASARTISTGFDFTQHNKREEYADNCFGKDPPVFEVLNVKCEEQTWQHNDGIEKVPNAEFSIGLKYRSSNIPLFLKNLIVKRIIMEPLPCYVAQLPFIGRNTIRIITDNDS